MLKKLLGLVLIAAAVAYLRDTRRRSIALGRSKGLLARGRRTVGGQGAIDDVTLAHKVETEIFRDRDAPKGTVDVNAQGGVVQLRGEVERSDLIEELVEKTRSVEGVKDVENLLHAPGEPAPMHQ